MNQVIPEAAVEAAAGTHEEWVRARSRRDPDALRTANEHDWVALTVEYRESNT